MPIYDTNNDDIVNGTSGNDYIYAGLGNDILNGKQGNDSLYAGSGNDILNGDDGDDYLSALGTDGKTGLYGGDGNDYIIASVPGAGQIHMGGGEGNDRLILNLANQSGHRGVHAYGGVGADRFEFTNTVSVQSPVYCRIDDFDPSRDSIWVNYQQIDFANLPSNMDIVEFDINPNDVYVGTQQWLRIDDSTLICLEGARGGGLENHFPEGSPLILPNISTLPTVDYLDPLNFVPYQLYQPKVSSLNEITEDGNYQNGTWDNKIFGGTGADLITANFNSIEIRNNNTIYGDTGDDVIDAGKGDDEIYGGGGDDLIAGGQDKDVITGGDGSDRIYGGSENDSINGDNGNDVIFGSTGNDSLTGGLGDDEVYGGTGNDVLNGWGGNDTLVGSEGDDFVYAQQGADVLNGNDGNDRLFGDSENDALYGGSGNDLLSGGAGRDVANGGGGADTFVFATGNLIDWDLTTGTSTERSQQLDLIEDFVVGTDKIKFDYPGHATSMSDLSASALTINGNLYYMLTVVDTNERVLVDVAENVTSAQFLDSSNFVFA